MEEGLQQILDTICAKDLHELSENDKAILRARSWAIGRRNRDKFRAVLNEKPSKVQPTLEGKQEAEKKAQENINDPFTSTDDDGVDE